MLVAPAGKSSSGIGSFAIRVFLYGAKRSICSTTARFRADGKAKLAAMRAAGHYPTSTPEIQRRRATTASQQREAAVLWHDDGSLGNDPTVTREVYDDCVAICVDDKEVARHKRATGKREAVINPLHYVDLISLKHRAAVTALAFADERLPKALTILRDRLIEREGPTATKTWMRILRLALDCSLEALVSATEIALARGTLDPSAIVFLLRQRGELAPASDPALRRSTSASRAQVVDLEAYRIAGLVEKSS